MNCNDIEEYAVIAKENSIFLENVKIKSVVQKIKREKTQKKVEIFLLIFRKGR